MTTILKVLISAAGLAVLVASPVLAASQARHQAAPAYGSTAVTTPNGKVVGADPDIQVRSEMLRDWPASAGAVGR